MTKLIKPDHHGLQDAAAILDRGGLVGMPTETVYGLAGDAASDAAVAAIYAAKGRPSFNPLIVHVAGIGQLDALVQMTDAARLLADTFWPGPLTMVLPLADKAPVSHLVTAGLPTLAVRVPAHPVARGLLEVFGRGVAAPSANPSGRVSPVSADHVIAGLSGRIDAVLDGGDCPVGLESTIIGFEGAPTILREGGVPAEALEQVLGHPLARRAEAGAITAPGQMASHYAPSGRVRIDVTKPEQGETYLGFGDMACDLNLSPTSDLAEAAANLFRHFHELDRMEAERIAVAPVPDIGLGRAINDRLRRAAAPR